MTKSTPIFPGAMTPEQIARKALEAFSAVIVSALAIAFLFTLFIVVN